MLKGTRRKFWFVKPAKKARSQVGNEINFYIIPDFLGVKICSFVKLTDLGLIK